MANIILLWSDILLRIKLSELQSFKKKLASKDSGIIFMIIIIYFYNYYLFPCFKNNLSLIVYTLYRFLLFIVLLHFKLF